MASRYVLSLITAALIGGILTGLLPGGSCGKLLKLLCGVFLLAAVLRPLGKVELPDVELWLSGQDLDARAAVEEGMSYARSQKRQVICSRLEAYFLDKAAELGMDIGVELSLDGADCPQAVRLTGSVSQSRRERLGEVLETELGIPKENQCWQEEQAPGGRS